MYAVVGCSECESLWIVEGRPETTACPRCRTRHEFGRLQQFVRTEDENEAREVRSAMLAARQGQEEAYERLESFAEMEAILDSAGITDEEVLASQDLDVGAVEEAGERATSTRESKSRQEVVVEALETLEEPTETAVVEYAAERGIPADYVRNALSKLARAGEIAATENGYRLV